MTTADRGARRWTPTALLGLVLGVILFGSCTTLIVLQNVLSSLDSASQYGKFKVPGSAVLTLPAGSIEIIVSQFNDDFKVPARLTVSVAPAEPGGAAPTLRRDPGYPFGSQRRYGTDHSFARVWTARIPRRGKYRVTAGGVDAGEAYELDLGHGPPVDAVTVWMVAGVAAAIAVVVWALFRRRSSGAQRGLS